VGVNLDIGAIATVVAILVGLSGLIVNLITCGIYIGKLEGFKELVNFRFTEQDKKLEKHNNFITRVYDLEKKVGIDDEKIDVANHRIEDLEEAQKRCLNANISRHTNS